jgi:hypothetical protein
LAAWQPACPEAIFGSASGPASLRPFVFYQLVAAATRLPSGYLRPRGLRFRFAPADL